MIEKYCYIPGGQFYRRYTYAFIHLDILHFCVNAVLFYIFFSIQNAIVFFISIPFCTLFSKQRIVGASGAIMAMISVTILQNGYEYILLLYMIYSAFAIKYEISNIHHLSHLLGACCGIIFYIGWNLN